MSGPQRPVAVSRGTRTGETASEAPTEAYRAITDPSEPTITPPPQPVSEDQPTEPTPTSPPTTAAAEEDPSSATPTEETPVEPTDSPTPSADVTVDATTTVEVAP